MSEIWPLDVKTRLANSVSDNIRPFRCLMLIPFEPRFEQISQLIQSTILQVAERLLSEQQPRIERADWVTSTGIIQQEIWQKILEADLVFCDITGFNPNVLFESGVCAAWKDIRQVVFIKDHFFRQKSAFDIAPIRYTEYALTSDGMTDFQRKIEKLTCDAIIAFPHGRAESPAIRFPLQIDFRDDRDDLRVFTPPFAHRRVVNETLEFGSIYNFPFSWASIGKEQLLHFSLEFSARFSNPVDDSSWIGVGLRSQHYYANYAHILYLARDGTITITEPDEIPPKFYSDNRIRGPMPIDKEGIHKFAVLFHQSELKVTVDDFAKSFPVRDMRRVFGPGLLRFQSSRCWMAIAGISVRKL